MSGSKINEVQFDTYFNLWNKFLHFHFDISKVENICILQLRQDIGELNELLKQAKRKKVQDILSLEVRKMETELINLREIENNACSMEVSPAPATSSQSKRYQIKLNGYGNITISK